MTLTEEQKPLRLKVLEVNTSFDGQDGVDYLIVDDAADTAQILTGGDGIYCQVADRLTADIFVKAVNEYPGTLAALEAAEKRAEEAEARRKCYECGSEMTACAQCNPDLAERDTLRAEVERLKEEYADKVDGLESDLSSAVDVLFRRGDDEAREWVRLNYPAKFAALTKKEADND